MFGRSSVSSAMESLMSFRPCSDGVYI
jgi:hypothetical protein